MKNIIKENLLQLELMANTIRQDIIKMLLAAGSGHSGGPLDLADVFTALYFNVLKQNPKNPRWEERDRLCLSCGHVAPVRYAAMARAGYFSVEELQTLRKLGSPLQGHPSFEFLPAVENSSGPLGQGTSVAVGMALAAKMKKEQHRVYCVVSDGEQQEGQCWEAYMFAGNRKLDNLTFILDYNNMQIDGYVEDIMSLKPIKEKYESFNLYVIEVDGHNIQEIIDACNLAKTIHTKPTMIIAHTIPGKGVDFMENDYRWHGSPPNTQQAKEALNQLEKIRMNINPSSKAGFNL
ncbi:MAG: Transketolase domain protein [candidate division TM6 bacterium GW2011_GWF2_32_72]|nr:MAG: Transketolase domain protein [candidate division TM6 bacterium GW2011_GWF2_32_72]